MEATDTRWLRVIVYDVIIGTAQVVQHTRPGNIWLITGHRVHCGQMIVKLAIEGGPGDGRELRRDVHRRMSMIYLQVYVPHVRD